MNITTVRGNLVDCHTCKTTTARAHEADAHAYARSHADAHLYGPGAVVANPPVVTGAPIVAPQAYAGQGTAFPRYAKTSINHRRWILLDLCTCGFAIPFHFGAWLMGGRKTKFS